jgi:hypothetical protein
VITNSRKVTISSELKKATKERSVEIIPVPKPKQDILLGIDLRALKPRPQESRNSSQSARNNWNTVTHLKHANEAELSSK